MLELQLTGVLGILMKNRVVAITGGNSGIGLAISELFLAKGYKVAIFARLKWSSNSVQPNRFFI